MNAVGQTTTCRSEDDPKDPKKNPPFTKTQMAVSTILQSSYSSVTTSLLAVRSTSNPFAPNQRSPASISLFVNSPSSALKIPPSSSARFEFKLRSVAGDGEELGEEGFGGGRGGEGNNNSGGGEGGGGGKGDQEGEGESKDGKKKMAAMSMSQKLTLGYAALVGGMLFWLNLLLLLLLFHGFLLFPVFLLFNFKFFFIWKLKRKKKYFKNDIEGMSLCCVQMCC